MQHDEHIYHESCDYTADYLQPVYSVSNAYLSLKSRGSRNDDEHGYMACEEQHNNATSETQENVPSEVTHKIIDSPVCCSSPRSSVVLILPGIIVGILIGSLCTGFIVYQLTHNVCAVNAATHPQIENTSITTAKTSSPTKSSVDKTTTRPLITNNQQDITTTSSESSPPTISTVYTPTTRPLITDSQQDSKRVDGKTFVIKCCGDGKFWHYNRDTNVVSAILQTSDNFIKFSFELQTNGSYKIKSVGGSIYIYDGYGVKGPEQAILHGSNQDDDHSRFLVTMETEGYTIRTKATGRYVRLDADLKVSTKNNIKDSRSLYTFVEKT